ncbi:hypothetical protein THRCLA_22467 [Thraustotheca clavata]|uniref:Transmembrane protein n=1 Tax=Thraustotheca clavata TaxID=74557 RepID=A0A1V9Z0T7_9STRA|nr:hypothetical protein THRCLA_22467 [Thraustotheca clavata]
MADIVLEFAPFVVRLGQVVFTIVGIASREACFYSGTVNGVSISLGGPLWDVCLVLLCFSFLYTIRKAITEFQAVQRVRKLQNGAFETQQTDIDNQTILEALTVTPEKRQQILTDALLFLLCFILGIIASVSSYNTNCTSFATLNMISCDALRLTIASIYLVGFLFLASILLWLRVIDPEERFTYIKFVLRPNSKEVVDEEASAHSDSKYNTIRYTGAGVPDSSRGYRANNTPVDL